MRILRIVFLQTCFEALRKKFLIWLLLGCFLTLSVSLLFSQLSLDDKGRLTVDFGLSAIQILMMILACFFSANFIANDLSKKALWMIFTSPMSPSLFFLGRYLGLALFLFFALIGFSFLLFIFFLGLKIPIQIILFYALFGFFMESLLLMAFVFFFSSFVNTFLVLFYSFSVFLIGHFLDTLFYFSEKKEDGFFFLISYFARGLPNLETINWKSNVVYQSPIVFSEFTFSCLYICIWIGFILSVSLFIMEKREYG